VQEWGKGCTLAKQDFESTFPHIPISPDDSPLLGFQWQNRYYSERFLPFGLRTAPYLFNLFAEVFHWILDSELQRQNLAACTIHYLDDFLMVLPPHANSKEYTGMFSHLCSEVGLTIKVSENEEENVVSFAGIEFDTKDMLICLPTKKLLKAWALVNDARRQKSLSLREIQKITGYQNFVSTLTPLGRTFLHRLYNMEVYFPAGNPHHRRRISAEAKRDLVWWS